MGVRARPLNPCISPWGDGYRFGVFSPAVAVSLVVTLSDRHVMVKQWRGRTNRALFSTASVRHLSLTFTGELTHALLVLTVLTHQLVMLLDLGIKKSII